VNPMWLQKRYGINGEGCAIVHKADREGRLVVTLPGLGQTMSEKCYLFSGLRQYLAREPVSFLQLEYRGHGDSDGDLEQVTISTMIEDAVSAVGGLIKEGFTPTTIILVGHALGSYIAMKSIPVLKNTTSAKYVPILISPPLSSPAYSNILHREGLQELDRNGIASVEALVPGSNYFTLSDFELSQLEFMARLGGHMTQLHGQKLSKCFLDECNTIDLIHLANTYTEKCYLIVGEEDGRYEGISTKLPAQAIYKITDVEYIFEHPTAIDQAIEIMGSIIKETD